MGPRVMRHLPKFVHAYIDRRSDVVRMDRQHFSDGTLFVRQQKTGREVWIPVHPALAAIIAETPSNLTFLVTDQGKPYSAAGFGNWFRDQCLAAGLHGCSAHGLSTKPEFSGGRGRRDDQLPAQGQRLDTRSESKRPRRPSLKHTIKAAGRSGKSVTAITTNGVTLHFGPDGKAVGNEWNEVCRVKN